MENEENKAVNEFLDGLDQPQVDPFVPEDIFSPEEEVTTESQEEEKLPFHKDQKVQKYIDKQVAKALEGIKPSETEKFIKETQGEDDLVSAFTAIIGNDTPEKQHALRMLSKTVTDLEEKALSATRQLEAEKKAEAQAEKELADGFDAIEDTFNVDLTSNAPQAKKMRNDFIDFVKKVAPKDGNGDIIAYPDFQATFETFLEISKRQLKPNTRARELASRSMERSSDASAAPEVKDNSWSAVERNLSKLFNR